MRYSNPFRFYITVSLLLFVIIGLTNLYSNYIEFSTGETAKNTNQIFEGVKDGWNEAEEQKDTVNITNAKIAGKDISRYLVFQKKHPNISINSGLDSLKEAKTFFNRFLYKKAETLNSFSNDLEGSASVLITKTASYLSTALFILLPIFALFLKLLYIRKKYTYIEHLIFVFHTQTIFYVLLILFFLVSLLKLNPDIVTNLFLLLFLIYLFLAIKNFYQQKTLKTIVKFLLIISVYTFIASVGTIIVTLIAFAVM